VRRSVSVAVSDGAGPDYFLVNPASVPYWLQVSLMNGLATSTPQNMIFTQAPYGLTSPWASTRPSCRSPGRLLPR